MRRFLLLGVALTLGGCSSTWSTSNVNPQTSKATGTQVKSVKTPQSVVITESDISNRKYKSLGDVEVTVNKTTIFNKDPTREMVDEKLKQRAAELNADAVVLVRYGTVGVSALSWGSLNGKGRAVEFLD